MTTTRKYAAPIRIGMISFAHYHANFWAEAFRDDPRVRLQAVWDDDAARGIDAARRFATAYAPSVEALLAEVDAVAITSETADHARWIALAAGASKPILCEKPLAVSRRQIDDITRVLAASGVPFMQSFPKRFDPANNALRDLLARGDLGEIRLVRVRHGHAHGRDPAFTAGWWTDPARSGGGTLLDEGIHAADFLRWLFGDPMQVTAMLGRGNRLRVEDTAIAIFRWPDGMIGEISTSWNFHAADTSVEIYGTTGTALLAGVDLASKGARTTAHLRVASGADTGFTDIPVTPGFLSGRFHHASATAFVDALSAGKPPPVSLEEARGALEMILAAYRAAELGLSVAIGRGT